MNKEDRLTYERDETITQLFHGQRYGPKMCGFDDFDEAETAVFNRLGEYEDTGLSPEEIEDLKYKHDKLQDFEVANNEKLRKQIASLENQLQEELASVDHTIKCEMHITVEGSRDREACKNDGDKKQRIPWEAD